jgi:hypothetical protein
MSEEEGYAMKFNDLWQWILWCNRGYDRLMHGLLGVSRGGVRGVTRCVPFNSRPQGCVRETFYRQTACVLIYDNRNLKPAVYAYPYLATNILGTTGSSRFVV